MAPNFLTDSDMGERYGGSRRARRLEPVGPEGYADHEKSVLGDAAQLADYDTVRTA